MAMKEKRKGHSRRRLLWLLLSIVFLLGGYLSLPYAQNAFVAWWEDDPLTPMCDMPNLRLYFDEVNAPASSSETKGFRFYDVRTRTSYLVAEGQVQGISPKFSPNQRWLMVEFFDVEFGENKGVYIYDIETNSQLLFSYTDDYSYWLPDSRLVYKPGDSDYWLIFNPEEQSTEAIPQSNHTFLIFHASYPLYGDNYFMAIEIADNSAGRMLEYTIYSHNLERRVLHRVPSTYFSPSDSENLSPNGRYYVYPTVSDDSRLSGLWFIDLEDVSAQAVLISNIGRSVVWSSDSRYFVLISPAGNIEVFDTEEQRLITRYEISGKRIIRLEWQNNGIWMVTESLLSNETQPNTLYWGQFNGTDFEMEALMDGYLSMAYNEIEITDSAAAFTQFSRQIGDGLPYSQDFYTLFLLNNDGDIVWTVENLIDNSIGQTPDKRYVSYVGVNEWIYLLDLETYQSCRVIENHNIYNSYGYQWLTIPQS
jgi:hypothetical protein